MASILHPVSVKNVNGPSKNWANIDGHLWLSCSLSGDLTAVAQPAAPCYEYNYKGFCSRLTCTHMPIHALNAKWPILHAHVECIWSRGT